MPDQNRIIATRLLTDQIFQDLKPLWSSDQNMMDNLVDQELEFHDGASVKPTASGRRCHPLQPSMDAWFPAFRGLDGLTAYHNPGNVSTISLSLNIMFRHYPKFFIYHLHNMATTKDPKVYISAVAVFRDAHINSYEMEPFSSCQRSKPIGLEFPKSFDDIMAALDHGRPLRRPVATPTAYHRNIGISWPDVLSKTARLSWSAVRSWSRSLRKKRSILPICQAQCRLVLDMV